MGVKKGFVNSKKHNAKVKLYYPANHAKSKEVIYYVTFKKTDGTKEITPVGKKSNGWNEKRAFEQRAKLIDKDKFGTGVHSDSVTVGELAVEYFEWAEVHNRSWKKTLLNYKKHLSEFDNNVVSMLDDKVITKLQKQLKDKELSDSYNNDIVGIFTKVIRFGVKRGIVEKFPFKNIIKLKIDNSRKRFLSNAQIDKLLLEVKENRDLYLAIQIGLSTGARAEDILNLKMSDIDFENKNVHIYSKKLDRSYIVPLRSSLEKDLNEIEYTGYIVGGGVRQSYQSFRRKIKPVFDELFNIGLSKKDEKITMHSLRHTFASHLAIVGTPLQNIKELLNHTDIKMTLRYAHLMPNAGAKYANKLYSESE